MVSSHPVFPPLTRMSTPVYVDPERTDTESEPFEDPESETPESPHIVASPVSLPDSTPPVCHVKESEGSDTSGAGPTSSDSTTPLSPGHPLTRDTPVFVPSLPEAAATSDVAFRKRFRSSYESSPSPTLPVRKRYRGTPELILGTDSEGDELEDEEVEESSGFDSESEDVEDEGLTAGDEGPGMDDESHGLDDESHGRDDEGRGIDDEGYRVESDGLGLEEEEEAVPWSQQQETPVVGTIVSAPLGLGYRALRRHELALDEDEVYSTFEVGQGSGSALKSKRSERVSAFRQPTLTTWTDPEDGMIYIGIPDYPPRAPPIQTPPSPDCTLELPQCFVQPGEVPPRLTKLRAPMCPFPLLRGSLMRFQSSYESSPSMSPPDLPSRKRYHGTSELVEDREDDDEEDEEIEESMDYKQCEVEEAFEGRGSPTVEDEDPAAGDEGLTTGVKGPGIDDEGYGLYDESRDIDDGGRSVESDGLGLEEEEEAVPGGQQQAASVIGTTVSAPLGLGYGALRRREHLDNPLTTWLGPRRTYDFYCIQITHPQHHYTDTTVPDTTPVAVETEGFLTELGAQVKMQGGLIRDHAEFGVRAGEGRSDIQSDMEASGENQDLQLQFAKERRARLELAEGINGIRRGQEPRGGA
ncbi:hypothetical protein Tco_1124626 [Tanacetum coccineum]|uniref:Uncharacterized protein n=1 Tax=Tanacetum coccineum TaxID=301880 RepID=A0ABQ5J7T0_9ASTR